jgi:hypothetical protein
MKAVQFFMVILIRNLYRERERDWQGTIHSMYYSSNLANVESCAMGHNWGNFIWWCIIVINMNNPTNKMGKICSQHTWKQWLLLGKHCAQVLFSSLLRFKPIFNTIPNQHFNCFSFTDLDCLNLQCGWTFVYPSCYSVVQCQIYLFA